MEKRSIFELLNCLAVIWQSQPWLAMKSKPRPHDSQRGKYKEARGECDCVSPGQRGSQQDFNHHTTNHYDAEIWFLTLFEPFFDYEHELWIYKKARLDNWESRRDIFFWTYYFLWTFVSTATEPANNPGPEATSSSTWRRTRPRIEVR